MIYPYKLALSVCPHSEDSNLALSVCPHSKGSVVSTCARRAGGRRGGSPCPTTAACASVLPLLLIVRVGRAAWGWIDVTTTPSTSLPSPTSPLPSHPPNPRPSPFPILIPRPRSCHRPIPIPRHKHSPIPSPIPRFRPRFRPVPLPRGVTSLSCSPPSGGGS